MKQEMKDVYDVYESIFRHGKKACTIEIESKDTFYKMTDAQRAHLSQPDDRKLEVEAEALDAKYHQYFADIAVEERAAYDELEEYAGDRSRNAFWKGVTIGEIVGAVGVGIGWIIGAVIKNK